MRQIGVLALAAGVLLAGCTGQGIGKDEPVAEERDMERTPYEQLDNAAQSSDAYDGGPQAAPVTPVQGGATVGGPLTATGQFQGVGGNPPPGSVTLTETAGGTRLSILIRQYSGNAQLRVAVVQGNCQTPGQVVQMAPQPVQTAAGGIGNLETEIPVPTAQILDGRHAIQLLVGEASGASSGAVAGCADLPAQQ